MKLRILHVPSSTVYPFKVQQKYMFWWLTVVDCSSLELAHGEAVMRIRGNGATPCEVTKPKQTVVELFSDF